MYKINTRFLRGVSNSQARQAVAALHKRFKSADTVKTGLDNDVYKKTLNLPNSGSFELSMKNICKTESKISKVCRCKSRGGG